MMEYTLQLKTKICNPSNNGEVMTWKAKNKLIDA